MVFQVKGVLGELEKLGYVLVHAIECPILVETQGFSLSPQWPDQKLYFFAVWPVFTKLIARSLGNSVISMCGPGDRLALESAAKELHGVCGAFEG